MTAVVESCGVSVGWHMQPVLRDVNLCVYAGERLALVGANGCGKTTLLRALSGLERPLSGHIRWLDRELPQGPARVNVLGLLLQDERPSHFGVRDLVTLGLALDGVPTAAQRASVDTALSRSDLTALGNRSCLSLSGGEFQRALLARAWVAQPHLMVLDEPSNHLDPARQAELLRRLDQLHGTCAVLLSTHDLSLAASCDRVALLHAGRIDVVGAPQDVLTPARLARTLGARVQRLDDPSGGPPFFRVLCERQRESAS